MSAGGCRPKPRYKIRKKNVGQIKITLRGLPGLITKYGRLKPERVPEFEAMKVQCLAELARREAKCS